MAWVSSREGHSFFDALLALAEHENNRSRYLSPPEERRALRRAGRYIDLAKSVSRRRHEKRLAKIDNVPRASDQKADLASRIVNGYAAVFYDAQDPEGTQ